MVDRMQNAVFHCLHLMRDKCKDFFRLSKLFWAKIRKIPAFRFKITHRRDLPAGYWKFFCPTAQKNLFDEKKNAYICTRKPRWWNGRHACFRYMCRKVCWFESGSGHRKPSQNTVKAFLYPAFLRPTSTLLPPLPATPTKKKTPLLYREAPFYSKSERRKAQCLNK